MWIKLKRREKKKREPEEYAWIPQVVFTSESLDAIGTEIVLSAAGVGYVKVSQIVGIFRFVTWSAPFRTCHHSKRMKENIINEKIRRQIINIPCRTYVEKLCTWKTLFVLESHCRPPWVESAILEQKRGETGREREESTSGERASWNSDKKKSIFFLF